METQIVTAKLKLLVSKDEKAALLRTAMAYRDALNHVSEVAFANGKLSAGMRLQKLVYDALRKRFRLPSQMACNAPRQVAASYKTLWARAKTNAEHRARGWTKRRYKGLDKAPRYTSLTVTYNYRRDYSFGKGPTVSVGTLDGRVKCAYSGYSKHLALIESGQAVFGTAKLWRDPATKEWYLLVSLEIAVPEVRNIDLRAVKGVDVGLRYLAVESSGKQARFWKGGAVRQQADHYVRVRRGLQRKGTRSATRRLRLLSLRETRFRADVNHQVSKQIVEPNTLVGFEYLRDIDARTERGSGPKATAKRKKANRRRSGWSFADLQGKTHYKAKLAGGRTVYVDADYTSKGCPCCGHVSDGNRPNKGLLFVCEACGTRLHADLVGARNVRMRTILVRQDWARTGCLSVTPEGSDSEAKARRLERYLELRWSSEPNPLLGPKAQEAGN